MTERIETPEQPFLRKKVGEKNDETPEEMIWEQVRKYFSDGLDKKINISIPFAKELVIEAVALARKKEIEKQTTLCHEILTSTLKTEIAEAEERGYNKRCEENVLGLKEGFEAGERKERDRLRKENKYFLEEKKEIESRVQKEADQKIRHEYNKGFIEGIRQQERNTIEKIKEIESRIQKETAQKIHLFLLHEIRNYEKQKNPSMDLIIFEQLFYDRFLNPENGVSPIIKHVTKKGAYFHQVYYDEKGKHCLEKNCELNKEEKP